MCAPRRCVHRGGADTGGVHAGARLPAVVRGAAHWLCAVRVLARPERHHGVQSSSKYTVSKKRYARVPEMSRICRAPDLAADFVIRHSLQRTAQAAPDTALTWVRVLLRPQVRDVSPPNAGSTASAIHLCIRNFIGGCGPLGEHVPALALSLAKCHQCYLAQPARQCCLSLQSCLVPSKHRWTIPRLRPCTRSALATALCSRH